MCGYTTIPDKCSGKHSVQDEKCDPQPSKILQLNSFKSTECLLLSLLCKDAGKKNEHDASRKSSSKELIIHKRGGKTLQQYRQGSANSLIGGSCQNLSGFRNDPGPPQTFRTRCYSLERIGDTTSSVGTKGDSASLRRGDTNTILGTTNGQQLLPKERQANLILETGFDNASQKQTNRIQKVSASAPQEKALFNENQRSKEICRSLSLLGQRNSKSCSSINIPVAEITVKPRPRLCEQEKSSTSGVAASVDIRTELSAITIKKRLCKSTTELSEYSFPHSSFVLAGTQSKMAF